MWIISLECTACASTEKPKKKKKNSTHCGPADDSEPIVAWWFAAHLGDG